MDSNLKNKKPSGGAFSMDDVGKTIEKPEKNSRSSLEKFPSYVRGITRFVMVTIDCKLPAAYLIAT